MKEYGDSFELNSFKARGVTDGEFIAYVIQSATKAIRRYKLPHRPVFLWRQLPKTNEEMLGWYAGPPSALQKRMEEEGWRLVDEEALGKARIVPLLNGAN